MTHKKEVYRIFSICICLVFLSQNIFAEEIFLSSLNHSALFSENSSQTDSKKHVDRNSSTSEEKKIAASFVEHGMSLYERGDVSGAVGDFSRALLLDPHNREAQRGLVQLASSQKLSAKQKMSLFLLEDLLRNVKALQKRLIYYEDKKVALTDEILEKGHSKQDLENEMKAIYDRVNIRSGNDVYEDQKDPLEVVNVSLNFEKDQMEEKIASLQKQCTRLRQIYKKIEVSEQSRKQMAAKKTDEPINIYAQNFYTQRDDFFGPFQKEKIKLEKEISRVQGQVEELRKQVQKKDEKIEKLTENFVDSALKLSEKKTLLEEKTGDIVALNTELEGFQSRFELGQRIIQEKEEKIQSLKQLLDEENFKAQKGNHTSEDILLKDKALKALNDKLLLSKNELTETQKLIEGKVNEIALLNKTVMELQEKLKDSEKDILWKNEKEQVFQNKLKEDKDKLVKENEELAKKVLEKDQQLKVLNENLLMAKGKIVDAQKLVKQKSEVLTKEVALKNKELGKLNVEIKSLHRKLKRKDLKLLAKSEKKFKKILLARDKKEKKLSKTLSSSQEELARSKKVIKKKEDEIATLNKTLDNLHVKFKNNEKAIYKKDKKISYLQNNFEKKVAEFRKKDQKELKKSLSLKDKELKKITKDLNSTKEELAKIKELVDKKINEIAFLNNKLDERKLEISKKEENLHQKNEEIQILKENFVKVKDDKQVKEKEVREPVEKSDEMLAMEYKLDELNDVLMMYRHGLAEANSKIKENDKQWKSFGDEIDSLQTKIYLQEKTIKSKEERIQLLKDKLVKNHEDKDKYNEGLRKIIASKSEELNKIKATMEMYKDLFSKAKKDLEKKDTSLNAVNAELSVFKAKIKSDQDVLKVEEVDQFSQKNRLAANEKKLLELEGILAIYREKLSDSHQIIKKKDANIATLDEQLNFVQVKLFEKNKVLTNTKKGLGVLEEQLMDVQEKLAKLKNVSGKKRLKQLKVKKEIQDLQSKVKNIHDSLLEQLSGFEEIDAHLAIGELN